MDGRLRDRLAQRAADSLVGRAAELALFLDALGDDGPSVVDGRRVGLTRLEFSVMQYLSRRAGKPVTRAALLQDVWGYDYDGGSNVVDVVRALRKKLGHGAASIETVTGVGYRLRR